MFNLRKLLALALGVSATLAVFAVACTPAEDGGKDDVHVVYYSDYDAVGDGKTDDFEAIKAAHEYANRNGYKVKADEGATYYIGAHTDTVYIKTDTDWSDATFIIDDTDVSTENRGWHVFEVSPDVPAERIDVPESYSIAKGSENVGMKFASPVLLRIVNSNKKDYIRYGKNTNDGSDRQEIILVDKDGNVDKDTPVLWDYEQVTSMTAYSVTDEAVTVTGGTFYTYANDEPISSSYFARGIMVKRSNTKLFGIKHYVQGEGEQGSPYTGFFVINDANNVTVEGCVLTGRRTYTNIKPTGAVSQGSYDTQAVRSNDVKWINCTQSNPITDTTYWGIMASNFCKNLKMEGCSLSRFDAHQGVYNATIKNTVLGQNLTIIGAGTLYIENVQRMAGDHFLELRQDYGSTWEGDIVLKDCTLNTTSSTSYVIQANWQDWEFGYTCYMPATVTLENYKVSGSKQVYVFTRITDSSPAAVQASKNPYVITQRVEIINEITPLALTNNKVGLLSGVQLVIR